MKRHTETAESQSSYTNFAFLPYGEWASEFEKGETPLIIAVKLVQIVGMGKTAVCLELKTGSYFL